MAGREARGRPRGERQVPRRSILAILLAVLLIAVLSVDLLSAGSLLSVEASPVSDMIDSSLGCPSRRTIRLTRTVTAMATETLKQPSGLVAKLVHRVKRTLNDVWAARGNDTSFDGDVVSGSMTEMPADHPLLANLPINREPTERELCELLPPGHPGLLRLGKRTWQCTVTISPAPVVSTTTITLPTVIFEFSTETETETSTQTVTVTVTTASATASPGPDFFCLPSSEITSNLRFARLNSRSSLKRNLDSRGLLDFSPLNSTSPSKTSSNPSPRKPKAAVLTTKRLTSKRLKRKTTTRKAPALPTNNAWVLRAPFLNTARKLWAVLNTRGKKKIKYVLKKGPWGRPRVSSGLWSRRRLAWIEHRWNVTIRSRLGPEGGTVSVKSGKLDPNYREPARVSKKPVVVTTKDWRKIGQKKTPVVLELVAEPTEGPGVGFGDAMRLVAARIEIGELKVDRRLARHLEPDSRRALKRRQITGFEDCNPIDDSLCAVGFDLCGTGLGAVSACFVPDDPLPEDPIVQTITETQSVTVTSTSTVTGAGVSATVCS